MPHDVVSAALAAVRQHTADMETLTLKYLGAETVARGRAIADPWARRSWYLMRFFDLGEMAGAARARMRRCRRTDGEAWRRHETVERDCRQIAEHLLSEANQTF